MRFSEKDELLRRTKGGLDVFKHYLGSEIGPGKKFKNPFYNDTRASCNLYYGKKTDRYFLVDFGDSTMRGDCFWFVSQWEHLDYHEEFETILRIIDQELCLNLFHDDIRMDTHAKPETFVDIAVHDEHNKNGIVPFHFIQNSGMTDSERHYWESYGIKQEILEAYNVRSLSSFSSTRADGQSYEIKSDGSPFFGYFFRDSKGLKIYRPGHQQRFLYAGKLPHPYVFGLEQLPSKGDIMYITGGEKDVLSLSSHGFNAICLNSETAKVPDDLLTSLRGRFNNIVILYDTDETGRREAAARVCEIERLGYSNVHCVTLPLKGTKEEKDISDFFRLGHDSKELSELTESVIYGGRELYSGIHR